MTEHGTTRRDRRGSKIKQSRLEGLPPSSSSVVFSSQKSQFADYTTWKGIETKTGIRQEHAVTFLLKELLDNALDYIESTSSSAAAQQQQPAIQVTLQTKHGKYIVITVSNSNFDKTKATFSKQTLQSIFDFDRYHSSKRNQFRPKGIHVVRDILGKDLYAEIIDLNDRPSIVERWTELCLVEQLFLELVTTKLIVSHDGNCGITVHKYYNQALALRKWILFTRPSPEFVVNLSDLSTRVIAELKVLENTQDVLKQAVGRIFENIDQEQYHRSIASLLRVRPEK